MTLDFFVPGEPVGKGRPRFSRKNGVAFTPAKTRTYEGIVRQFAAEKMNGQPLMEGPLFLHLRIFCRVPDSWPTWKRALAAGASGEVATVRPTRKPDLNNIYKAVEDALNCVVWKDDAQVVQVLISKYYDAQPGVMIRVEPLVDYPCQITKRPANG